MHTFDQVLCLANCSGFGTEALTLPSLAGVTALKSLITLYINICKIMFFSSTQFAYIYVHSYFMLVTQQTYLYASIQFSVSVL